jgi:hypothetical protein
LGAGNLQLQQQYTSTLHADQGISYRKQRSYNHNIQSRESRKRLTGIEDLYYNIWSRRILSQLCPNTGKTTTPYTVHLSTKYFDKNQGYPMKFVMGTGNLPSPYTVGRYKENTVRAPYREQKQALGKHNGQGIKNIYIFNREVHHNILHSVQSSQGNLENNL